MKLDRNKLFADLDTQFSSAQLLRSFDQLALTRGSADDWLKRIIDRILVCAEKQMAAIPTVDQQLTEQAFWDATFQNLAALPSYREMGPADLGATCNAAVLARRKRHET